MRTTQPGAPVIRLRVAEFRHRAKKAGLTSDDDVADRLGMNRTTVWRLLNERMAPGQNFIAAVLDAFPDVGFPDVFEVVPSGKADGRGAA